MAAIRTDAGDTAQLRAAVEVLRDIFGDTLHAVYLHGSAVSKRLGPQSDLDLLAVTDRKLGGDQRKALLAALLRLSGRHPRAPGGPRCLELILFRLSDLAEAGFPARAEFTYGEWLRGAFEAGGNPMPGRDPEHTLILAQARMAAVALHGPGACELLPEIPPGQIRRAMREALPALMGGLRGDERNVLLTLARMWRTASTGEFVSKAAAAEWAIPQVGEAEAALLGHARRACLGEIADDWSQRGDDALRLAENLSARVLGLTGEAGGMGAVRSASDSGMAG